MIKNITHLFTAILLFTTLSSCGVPLPLQSAVRQFSTTDKAFESYITEFEQLGKTINKDISFVIGDIPVNFGNIENIENDSFQGVCYTYTDGSKEVIIRKTWWDNHTDDYRRSLIFHELGHCRLDREHLDDTREVSGEVLKISMMNSVIVRPRDYERFTDPYHEELFTQDTADLFEAWSLSVEGTDDNTTDSSTDTTES